MIQILKTALNRLRLLPPMRGTAGRKLLWLLGVITSFSGLAGCALLISIISTLLPSDGMTELVGFAFMLILILVAAPATISGVQLMRSCGGDKPIRKTLVILSLGFMILTVWGLSFFTA